MEVRELPEAWLVRLILIHLGDMLSRRGVSYIRSVRGMIVDSAGLLTEMPEGLHRYLLDLSRRGQEIEGIYELLGEAKWRYPKGKPKQLCLFVAGNIELESLPDLCIFWGCLAALERWYHDDAKSRPFEIIQDETEIAETLMMLCPVGLQFDLSIEPLLDETNARRQSRIRREYEEPTAPV